jgi:glycosyltransferase involved in cell wall biosynthesis
MRIALVSEHASPLAVVGGVDAGGQNVHVDSLARELARLGHEVVVHTRRDDAALPSRVALCAGASVHHVDAGPPRPVSKDDLPPYMDEFGQRLYDAWGEWRPDVVHAHYWMSGLATLAAARPLDIPVAQTFHALGKVKRRHHGAGDTSPPQRLAAEAMLAEEVDLVVATAAAEVFELSRMGAQLSRVTVVPCGVDLKTFRPDGAAEPRAAGGKRVLVLGRLVQRKGIDDVIRSLRGARGAHLVVGGGPPTTDLEADREASRLRSVARAAGVLKRVELRGQVERAAVPALIRSADVVVCAPWYEPFGLVALEAMACGVPVVATAVGGLCDTVVDGVTGLHVPPRSPGALAAAIRRVLYDDAFRTRLGAAGAQRARTRFGWPQVARSTAAALAGITQQPALAATHEP